MKRLKLLLLLMLMGFGIAGAFEPDSATLSLIEQTWQEFRQIHPYNFQTVALKHVGDASIIIASEPSPSVSVERIHSLFITHGGYCKVMQQKLGCDGYIKDVVGIIPDKITEGHPFSCPLFYLLYGNHYKAYYTDLDNPSQHVYFAPFEYDLNYTKQLQDLIPRNHETDTAFLGSLVVTNALYYSKEKGYVAWPIDVESYSYRDAARKFTLDTDLILGAVLTPGGHLIIIGRERQVPVTIYPPLRAETIKLMAQNSNTDFEQYFDSNRATTDADGQYMTPIVMSKELVNTEYGNLLIQCDQMLKSWSENDYNQDADYQFPAPAYFPFVKDGYSGAKDRIDGIYWNQNIVKVDLLDDKSALLFTTDRTGSLPVKFSRADSYDVSRSGKASEYFAELNQPELVRLAQYTMLHEIFGHCRHHISNSPGSHSPRRNMSPRIIPERTDSWLKSPTVSRSPNRWIQGGMPAPRRILPKPAGGITISRLLEDLQRSIHMAFLEAQRQAMELARALGKNSELPKSESFFDNSLIELGTMYTPRVELGTMYTPWVDRKAKEKEREAVVPEALVKVAEKPILGALPYPRYILPEERLPSEISIKVGKTFIYCLHYFLNSDRGFVLKEHLLKIKRGLTLDGRLFETTRQLGEHIEETKATNGGKSPINNVTVKGYSANEVEVNVDGKAKGILQIQQIEDDPIFKAFGTDAPILNRKQFINAKFHFFGYILFITDDDPAGQRAA